MDTKPYKLKLRRGTFPVTLAIDGQTVTATVKRLSIDEHGQFSNGFARINDPHSRRLVSMRMPGDEQERRRMDISEDIQPDIARFAGLLKDFNDPRLVDLVAEWSVLAAAEKSRGPFVISDEEIRRRRLVEMTDAQRADYDKQAQIEEDEARAFIAAALTDYFRLDPRQVVEEIVDEAGEPTGDELEITSGADFVRVYGARQDVLFSAMTLIATENILGDRRKNALSSQPDSPTSLDGRELQATTTSSSDGTAASAASERSASTATAMASSEATSSGTTAAVTT